MHARDEVICLGILSGLDLKTIIAISSIPNEPEITVADRRMKEFLRLHRFIPMFFLFLGSKRFEEDGYKWAPNFFIGGHFNIVICKIIDT
jgi:hypothetical protein